jgi:hypothetical protein
MNVPRSADGCEFEQIAGIDRLDEAVAEHAQRGALRDHVVAGEHALLDARMRGAIRDQRAAGMIDERRSVEQAGAALGDLTRSAEDRHHVTLAASRRVEDRAEAIGDRLGAGEFLRGLVHQRLRHESVRQSVESRGRLGGSREGRGAWRPLARRLRRHHRSPKRQRRHHTGRGRHSHTDTSSSGRQASARFRESRSARKF